MTDRELLELAAKAAAYRIRKTNSALIDRDDGQYWRRWDPILSMADAFQLAVDLGLVVDFHRCSAGNPLGRHAIWLDGTMSNNELTRRAIVRAAAEIGRATGDD